jgi:thiamine biosynthesis lipoprotein
MMHSNKLSNKPKPKALTLAGNTIQFEAIGTIWLITIDQTISKTRLTGLSDIIKKRIDQFDRDYSRFRSDSLVTSISKREGNYRLPEDAEPLLDLYEQLYDISDGLVNPLIGKLISEAGYDSNYSFRKSDLNPVPAWDDALDYKFPVLITKQPVLLDFGAAGKGYLVDLVAALIKENGIENFCINAGGDILQSQTSEKVTEIGLEHPINLDEVVGIARLNNRSLCGSAGNRRTWDNFHHIINPKTKSSPNHLLASWVVADSTLLADGLATALFFIQAAKLRKYYTFEYVLIRHDLSLDYSDNFPADFFTNEGEVDDLSSH